MNVRCLPSLIGCCAVPLLLPPSLASASVTPVSNAPAMTASAASPVTANSRALITYALTGTDKDTFNDPQHTPPTYEDNDLTIRATAVAYRSMVTGDPSAQDPVLSLRGWDSTGKVTWDVTGTTKKVTSTTTFVDDFRIDNNRSQGDVLKDLPVIVYQQVTVNPPPPPPGP